MEFRHISELEELMSDEQKAESKRMYDKYYGIPFGHLEPVMCGPCGDTNGEEYLVEVDLEDFDN